MKKYFEMIERIRVFGIEVDPITERQAVARILAWTAENRSNCLFVVTPNVDHIVKLEHDTALQSAYRAASLTLVDGRPVAWAARLLGRRLPAVVPGSDLCPAVFSAATAAHQLQVFLLGAGPGVAERAAREIERTWPHVRVAGFYSPPMGFDDSTPESDLAIEMINARKPDLLLVGLGAPRQEKWIHAVSPKLDVKVALCIGATIDFLAGEKKRAPRIFRRLGFEWLYRAFSEPRRLLRRYLHDAAVFPQICLREWLNNQNHLR